MQCHVIRVLNQHQIFGVIILVIAVEVMNVKSFLGFFPEPPPAPVRVRG